MSSSSAALTKRSGADMALMPPPLTKRIKRPATVLSEDEYTEALSDIIARDYFPGLAEVKAQEEYLDALESKNQAWISEAGQNLRHAMSPVQLPKRRRDTRDSNYDTPRSWQIWTPVADTPRLGNAGGTPVRVVEQDEDKKEAIDSVVNTTALSLSAFQAQYTSEDNESFNQVLDKQNAKRREKHAHLWTKDQRIPSKQLITHRQNETRLLKQQEEDRLIAKEDGREIIPITTGAVSSRPAKPDAWQQKHPNNTFMFNASSVDEDGIQTVMEVKERMSKAGPKETVYANTRFPTAAQLADDDPGPVPPSPSLNTDIVARRDAARANRAESEASFVPGGETPRVNGYTFVDEDEPENINPPSTTNEPSYRDILAGQSLGDGNTTPNPFKIHEKSRREDLHHRLVERDKAKKRIKERQTVRTPILSSSLGGSSGGKTPTTTTGNMTPAARKLMEKLGRTPLTGNSGKTQRPSSHDMWTPGNTPRRK